MKFEVSINKYSPNPSGMIEMRIDQIIEMRIDRIIEMRIDMIKNSVKVNLNQIINNKIFSNIMTYCWIIDFVGTYLRQV